MKALIVFIKNPVQGKVKTRLAHTIGSQKALVIYQRLLTCTRAVSEEVNAERFVFYSDFADAHDEWNRFNRLLQSGTDLGEKMRNAFSLVFALGFPKVIIIGSDCPELTTSILEKAFDQLDTQDVVVGPAADGGYYLLGMKQLQEPLFVNKDWSTATVLQQTLNDLDNLKLRYALLPVLNDIDEEKDLKNSPFLSI